VPRFGFSSPAEMEFHDTKSPEAGKYLDDDPNSEKKPVDQTEDRNVAPQSNYSLGGAVYRGLFQKHSLTKTVI